jgi:hypothetical protein
MDVLLPATAAVVPAYSVIYRLINTEPLPLVWIMKT